MASATEQLLADLMQYRMFMNKNSGLYLILTCRYIADSDEICVDLFKIDNQKRLNNWVTDAKYFYHNNFNRIIRDDMT